MRDSGKQGYVKLTLPPGIRNAAEARAAAKALAAKAWQCEESDFELLFRPSLWLRRKVWVQPVPPQVFAAQQAAERLAARRIWWGAAGMCALVTLGWGLAIWKLQAEHAELQTKLSQVEEKIKAQIEQRRARQQWVDAHRERLEKIKPRLELDLNPVFDAIESIALPQVRLRHLDLDASTQTVQLSYEMASMAQFQALNDALTQDKLSLRCQLLSGQTGNESVEGLWRCRF